MAEDRKDRCPGCGKHCSLKSPGCAYGRRYAQKHAAPEAPRWAAQVTPDGPLWRLLDASRSIRHALKEGTADEAGLMAGWTPREQETLAALLNKFNAALRGS